MAASNKPVVVHITSCLLEYLLDVLKNEECTEDDASLWEILEFIKLLFPICITGVLEEDP
ncbi:hypothetical protein H5410_022182 [Solanum commersonii]|uniref:Uncharacterized protein n=1 Tax=Solanum commersonii TaxID=4109 RepID=A0A9J5ZEP4_SOLCO|nr:hypothetical protein H5410_022182 [Solanum commersonii]